MLTVSAPPNPKATPVRPWEDAIEKEDGCSLASVSRERWLEGTPAFALPLLVPSFNAVEPTLLVSGAFMSLWGMATLLSSWLHAAFRMNRVCTDIFIYLYNYSSIFLLRVRFPQSSFMVTII
jgi:hypothetical protein